MPTTLAPPRRTTQPWRPPAAAARDSAPIAAWIRWAPLVGVQAYLGFSLLVLAVGPGQFVLPNPAWLFAYCLLGQLAILMGYLWGMTGDKTRAADVISPRQLGWLKLSIVAMLVLAPPSIIARNYGEVSIVESITNPGAAYYARIHALYDRTGTPIMSIFRGLAGPLTALVFPLGVLYRTRLSAGWRVLWFAAMAGLLLESFLSGAAKGIFDLLIALPPMLLAATAQTRARASRAGAPVAAPQRRRRGSKVLKLITFAVLAAGAIFYFAYSRQSRYQLDAGEYPPNTTGWSGALYGVELPEAVEYPLHMLSHYLAHGYVGLAECMELDFEWCSGVGHSTFLSQYAGKFIDDPDAFSNLCYPVRLERETGYDAYATWHTIYPWLASDLTFPGAIGFIGVMGFLLARSWAETLRGQNPFATAMCCQLVLLFFYVPANNCRLMFSEEAITFWGLAVLWWYTSQSMKARTAWRLVAAPRLATR